MPQFVELLESPGKAWERLGTLDGRSSAERVHHPMEMIERAYAPAVVS